MLSYHNFLKCSPGPSSCIPGDAPLPQLVTESDFAGFATMAQENWGNVYTTFTQKYILMHRIVSLILESMECHIDFLIMTARMPGMMKFPISFQDKKVFIVSNPELEGNRLLPTQKPFITLYEGFVRFPMEIGNNELQLEFHNIKNDSAKIAFRECGKRLDQILASGVQNSKHDNPQK